MGSHSFVAGELLTGTENEYFITEFSMAQTQKPQTRRDADNKFPLATNSYGAWVKGSDQFEMIKT